MHTIALHKPYPVQNCLCSFIDPVIILSSGRGRISAGEAAMARV